MKLHKRNQLMMLALSERNPYWSRMRFFETGRLFNRISPNELLEITGLSRETPKNWRQGKEVSPIKAQEVFSNILAYLDQCADRARGRNAYDGELHASLVKAIEFCSMSFDADGIDIFAVGEQLGMSRAHTQQTLDAAIYDYRPLLPAAYYPKGPRDRRERDFAQQEADQYEGVYLIWAKRGLLWMQCPMEVRYLQEVSDGRFLRCKMNIPVLRDVSKPECTAASLWDYFEYDGFVSIREQRLFWTFEKRQRTRNDYFYMITDTASMAAGVQPIVLAGTYLTTGQDAAQSVVTDEVLVRRAYKETSDPQQRYYRDIMTTNAKLLSDACELARPDSYRADYLRERGRQDRH